MKRRFIFLWLLTSSCFAELQHDKFNTLPKDLYIEFDTYVLSFDSDDESRALGIAEWVSYEMNAYDGQCIDTVPRPKWSSPSELVSKGFAPHDSTYTYSRNFRNDNPDWFVRGHLQMNLIAAMQGKDKQAETFTLINAVPQRKNFNSGIWQDLENFTIGWANQFGKIWVITGPIVVDETPAGFIGEDGEFKAAIPDALFKIVIKKSNEEGYDTLAFIYPQIGSGYTLGKPYPHEKYLTSISEIESLTGLIFFNAMEFNKKEEISEKIWSLSEENKMLAC